MAELPHADFKKPACNILTAIHAPFKISSKRPNKSGTATAAFASDKSSPGARRHDALQQSRAKRPAPEAADADSSTAEREMMNPSNSRVTQPRICFMQIECINNIAMRF